jgi:hypothetical protein
LPASSMPLAGQWVSTETSDGSALVRRDAARPIVLFRPSGGGTTDLLKRAARIIHFLQRPFRKTASGSIGVGIPMHRPVRRRGGPLGVRSRPLSVGVGTKHQKLGHQAGEPRQKLRRHHKLTCYYRAELRIQGDVMKTRTN